MVTSLSIAASSSTIEKYRIEERETPYAQGAAHTYTQFFAYLIAEDGSETRGPRRTNKRTLRNFMTRHYRAVEVATA